MDILIIFYSTYSNKYTSQIKLKFNIINHVSKKEYYSHTHQKLIYTTNRIKNKQT